MLGASSANTLIILAAAVAGSNLSVTGLLTASGSLRVSGNSDLAGDHAANV